MITMADYKCMQKAIYLMSVNKYNMAKLEALRQYASAMDDIFECMTKYYIPSMEKLESELKSAQNDLAIVRSQEEFNAIARDLEAKIAQLTLIHDKIKLLRVGYVDAVDFSRAIK